jgi:PIN like domain
MGVSADTSKKQSGLNLPWLPESLGFFVDRSLGRRVIPDALRAAGAPVELHDNHFPQDAQDQMWLPEAGKRGRIGLTKDKHLGYRAAAAQATRA